MFFLNLIFIILKIEFVKMNNFIYKINILKSEKSFDFGYLTVQINNKSNNYCLKYNFNENDLRFSNKICKNLNYDSLHSIISPCKLNKICYEAYDVNSSNKRLLERTN